MKSVDGLGQVDGEDNGRTETIACESDQDSPHTDLFPPVGRYLPLSGRRLQLSGRRNEYESEL
jgi:hypothetical protein